MQHLNLSLAPATAVSPARLWRQVENRLCRAIHRRPGGADPRRHGHDGRAECRPLFQADLLHQRPVRRSRYHLTALCAAGSGRLTKLASMNDRSCYRFHRAHRVGKAYRGALNNTEGADLARPCDGRSASARRASIRAEVEDVVMGCAMQQGTRRRTSRARALIACRPAGDGRPAPRSTGNAPPVCRPSHSPRARSCFDGVEIAIGGGIEFDQPGAERAHEHDFTPSIDELMAMKPDMYMSMLDTAEIVAERYKIGARPAG